MYSLALAVARLATKFFYACYVLEADPMTMLEIGVELLGCRDILQDKI
jgi:hypothetical protein